VYDDVPVLNLTKNDNVTVVNASITIANKTVKPTVIPTPTPTPKPTVKPTATPYPKAVVAAAPKPTPVPIKIIFFYQQYCSGCQQMEPIIAKLPYPVTRIDVNANQAMAKQYGVTTTPTTIITGRTTHTLTGVVTYEQIMAAVAVVS
jgi:protein-disulfide isomerase